MLNEIEEFRAYTGEVVYRAENKYDSGYLGRFTYGMLLKFEGLARVLTTVARGYMFRDGEQPDIDLARRVLCAWCSVPDNKKATPKEEWQYKTDFRELHGEFPELVSADGAGWLCAHVRGVIKFVRSNPNKTAKTAQDSCEKLKRGFDREWRKKVVQLQVPLFARGTKGAWVLRFDDILADALELGALRERQPMLTEEQTRQLADTTPKGVPEHVIPTLVEYCLANKPPDSEWVVLPVANLDAYFGTSSFSRKWLKLIPEDILLREWSCGVCRGMVAGVSHIHTNATL